MRLYQRGKRGIWWLDATIAGERITRSTRTTSKQAAQEWAAKVASDTWRVRRLGEKPSVTWGSAVLEWLAEHPHRRSLEDMKDRLRFLTESLEHIPLAQITAESVHGIVTAKTMAPATRNRYVAEVSKILHYAHRKGWVEAVPALTRYHEPKPEPRWLTHEQADKLIAELPEHLADMATFSLATGLRESNVRLLRWSQVDAVRAVAWVLSSESKNGRALSVPLNADAIEVLARRKGRHPIFVFTYEHKDGTAKPVRNCSSKAWYKAVERAGLSGFRWHDLRHTWATWHLIKGTPPQVLQALGGWSSNAMVQRYAHIAPNFAARYADGSLRDKSVTTLGDETQESPQVIDSVGWLMGLEPTTTGITKRQSTAKLLNINDALARKRRKTA